MADAIISYTHLLYFENATLLIVFQTKFMFVPTLSILHVLHYKIKGVSILIYNLHSLYLQILLFDDYNIEIFHRYGGAHKIIPEQYPFLILKPFK